MKSPLHHFAAAPLLLLLAACGDTANLPSEATHGTQPTIPKPTESFIPTVDIAPAKAWPEGMMPKPAADLSVKEFAGGLDHPRWLYVLPNGDVLVAETNKPKGSGGHDGIKGFVFGLAQKRAGAGTPSANRITLLRDADGDGVAEMKVAFLENLNSPFGMALVGSDFYVANADAVMRFPYREGATKIAEPGQKVADLPGMPLNHHWTKSLVASPDGAKLYVGVGSNSDHGENGLDKEERRAAILEIDRQSGETRVYASGLRNPVGMAFEPQTKMLWVSVNERDELGSDLVPDYMTSVQEGGFYGWPFSYWGQHVDTRVPQDAQQVAKAIFPDYALGNHTSSLGLTFASDDALPERYRNGAFVGQHGSWNRKPLSGYKVIFVPFADGKPSGKPLDVLTGFLNDKEEAQGRPVGVAISRTGALLVADDVGNKVWHVAPSAATAAPAARPASPDVNVGSAVNR